jgi:alpha-tubulin suppressor-like RCC1 family protein
MRFIEIPALITEDIEDPSIVDITEPITVSISGTTMTINGQDTDENSTKLIVSGEATVTLTGDTTVDAFTLQNIRAPSLHKISVKTNNKGNFTYVPNNTVTASSVSTTTKTGSDFEILLITTNGGETYVDFDMADYTSPALYTSNALTGFDISELTSTYGATAKLYKPDGTLLTTVNSATTGGGVNFGYTESLPGDVEYKLEVTDDLGRKSTYNLPRKWINYAMGTGTTPGFQKFRLEGTDDDYTTTVMFPSLGSSSTAKVYRTSDHGYLGINFKIQGRNSTGDDWVDIANADEDDEVLAFGDFLYHRVWVKPTAKATTTVSSSNVVTLTLSNLTEENVTTSFDNFDPYDINESTNTYVFEETTKIGTVPFTVTLGTETYTNAVTATTEEVSTVPNTDMTAAGPNMKHTIVSSWATLNTTVQVSGDGKYIIYEDRTTAGKIQVMKGDPENGYTNYTTITYTQGIDSLVSAISYDGKYILFASWNNSSSVYEMHLNDESAGTYSKLSTTYSKLGNHRCYAPAFIPRSGNYDFVLTGSDNNATCYIRLYKHNTGTDTWTAKSLITDPTNKPTGDENRGYKAKSFTSDGKYLMFGNMGVYGGYEMYTIDWDANTAVFSGANYSNNGNVGASGAVSFDGKYVLIFHTDSNSRKIFKNNDAGDWSSATDVTTDFTFADTDNDQGHGFSFCGEHSEFFVSGMNAGAIRMYSWYAKNSVTLTFSNPTLTLTGQNVTISSAKLYRDDVLFHTYGTESNVVLRSDQTGTYQAVVNDVYYSNRVTPDFTTTRSVSAPQLEFDGYNRLNLSNITPTSTTLGLPDGTTRDLTTQSNVYIYEPGTYTANVQTSETFAYLSNVVTSQPSQNPTDVGPTFTFDEYNRLAISNITQTSSTLKYGSNTYDTNTASNVYVTDMGEYKLEARDANTFVMSNVYVGAVSQHPSDVVPTLTFDGYKKLTIDNVDTIETATIKKDGAAFATTTSNTIYIRDTGTYTAEVKGSNVYVTELSKQVNTIAMKTDYTNIWAGEYGGMVVDSDGKLYTWGDNGNNESGRGASDRTPTHISTISDPVSNVWVEGAAGRTRIVKTSTDKWYMWGMNSSLNKIFGQTGDQTAPVDVTSNFTTHFGAQGTSDTTRIIKVVMSSSECSALADDGKVWSWGGATNLFGSVGHTLTESSGYGRYVCTSVSGVNYTYAQPNKPLSYGYNISFVADSSTGSGRYTGVWNANPSSYGHGQPIGFEDPANVSSTGNGQNGGSYVPSYTPTHSDTTLYLYSDNGLWYTISVNYATTIPVPFKNTTDGSTELSNITDIRSLDSGKLALDSNGDVWQWGTLRTGSTVYATKQTGLDSVTIIGIGTGFFTAYAWDATGTIYSIGRGTEGQLGNGANSDQDSTWQTVTTLQGKTIYGIYGAGYSVFAHTSDGVYACGQGTNGRLGM